MRESEPNTPIFDIGRKGPIYDHILFPRFLENIANNNYFASIALKIFFFPLILALLAARLAVELRGAIRHHSNLAFWILTAACPPSHLDGVAGDIEEKFAEDTNRIGSTQAIARLWGQVISTSVIFALDSLLKRSGIIAILRKLTH
jgi:hypothetical protein